MNGFRIFSLALLIILSVTLSAYAQKAATVKVLATVNGTTISEGDLLASVLLKRDPKLENSSAEKQKLVNELVNRQLIRDFLKERKVTPNTFEFDQQWNLLLRLIKQDNSTLEDVLQKLGITEKQLKAEVALPLAWKQYCVQSITDEMMQKEFDSHKTHWDGTQVVVKQIYLKVPEKANSEQLAALKSRLASIREEIQSGKINFSDAAKKYSESPSAENGGDIGKFQYYSRMPLELTSVAFNLKSQEISEPFPSSFGMHLYQVTEIIPGDFSFRDVRAEIFNRMSEDLWKKTGAELSKSAKIEYQK